MIYNYLHISIISLIVDMNLQSNGNIISLIVDVNLQSNDNGNLLTYIYNVFNCGYEFAMTMEILLKESLKLCVH
jgi:hypothetical protein